jgi:hypothetical protein
MRTMTKLLSGIALITTLGSASALAQHSTMPPGMSHEDHLRQLQTDDALKQRGTLAMGFDQDKTVHHFLLQRDGGVIVVTAKDPSDAESIAQIRSHFQEIATSFAEGAFNKPVATHGTLPPGAALMTANTSRIQYRYEERAAGASVVIETADTATRDAIHDFLRYQIVEHKTGDPLSPPR